MQKITPFLWFDNNAEEAMNFYTSVFPDSSIGEVVRNGKSGPGPEGSVLTASMKINGQDFALLNGGPQFKFTEAVSFVINCENQEEVDRYWAQLTADGGQEQPCGWLKDKFGLSWQVVPKGMKELFVGDGKKVGSMMQALMQMKKLNLQELQDAYNKG